MSATVLNLHSTIPPWLVIHRSLQALGEAGKQEFARIQKKGRQKQGFVIGRWDKEGVLRWYYLCGKDCWGRFGDDTESEIPYIYKTLAAAIKKVGKLQDEYHSKGHHIGLVYWIHPDAYDQPLSEYVRFAEGSQFPGCPRQ